MSKTMKKSINEIGVNAIYDGNHLDMDVFFNENGKKTKMHTLLDNEDISRLLHIPIDSVPLEQRLKQDFSQSPGPRFMNSEEPFLRPEESLPIIVLKPKRKTKKAKKAKKAKKTSTKKTKRLLDLYKTPSPKILHIHLKPKTKKQSTI